MSCVGFTLIKEFLLKLAEPSMPIKEVKKKLKRKPIYALEEEVEATRKKLEDLRINAAMD